MSKARIEALLDELRALGPIPFPDEDVAIQLLPPASAARVKELERACGGELPEELASFLAITEGFRPLEFQPEPEIVGGEGFGRVLRASHYGNGDGLAIEPAGERCRVWWVGHDPWFVVYWADSIADLLEVVLAKARRRKSSDEGDDFDDWEPEARATEVTELDADPVLAKFARSLPAKSRVYDLRGAAAGTEIGYECLELLADGWRLRRDGLLFAFSRPQRANSMEPVPIRHYLDEASPDERAILLALPKGSLVLHEDELPPGGKMDTSAHPEWDVTRRPPFEVMLAPRRKWWRFWG
jgi:hypothetical protein